MNPKFKYILDYFRAVYQVPAEIMIGYGSIDQKVNIFASNTSYFDEFSAFPLSQIVWKTWQGREIPILFPGDPEAPALEFRNGRAIIHDDLLASAFFFLSGWQEYVYMRRHNAVRYPFRESLQHRLHIARLPVVNYYFDILKTAIERCYSLTLHVSPWGESPLGICLTHDVDTALSGWEEDLAATLRQARPLAALGILRDLLATGSTRFNFSKILATEQRHRATSSFYFLARREKVFVKTGGEKGFVSEPAAEKVVDPEYFFQSRRSAEYSQAQKNADYDIRSARFQQVFEQIQQHGSEVGIHGGFGASLSLRRFREELQRFGRPVKGGRFHYLCFDLTQTLDILEQSGQNYDSTLGFAEAPGFRNGIAFPFVPFHIRENRPARFLEIPLIAMDTTYRSYQKTGPGDALSDIRNLMKMVAKFGGCLTLLWHNAYFSPYKFAGWAEIYEEILREGNNQNALLLSGEQVFQRWGKVLSPPG